MNFAQSHLATLCKYAGISFIAGAVNHGFFSEARSVWTASLGVLFYLLGAWLDMRNRGVSQVRWADVLGFGLTSSIGLGFFTGGLQHFPDSPDRSAWVVPLGFVLSLGSMYFTDWRGQLRLRALLVYGLVSFAVVVTGSALAWSVLQGSQFAQHAHSPSHEEAHDDAHAVAGQAGEEHPHASEVTPRSVVVTMGDDMRFNPMHWQATSGETVLIRLRNTGKVPHEFVLGTQAELDEHAQQMKQSAATHLHHLRHDIRVDPGESAELRMTFADAGTLYIACFEPGHYEAGMRGSISVLP